jgi:hypothetical protein
MDLKFEGIAGKKRANLRLEANLTGNFPEIVGHYHLTEFWESGNLGE